MVSRKIPTLRTISSSRGGQQWGHTQVHYSDIVRAFLAAYAAGCRCRLKPERASGLVDRLLSVPASTSCFALAVEFLLQALYDRTRASRRNRKTRPGILLLVPLRNNSARPPDGAGSPPHRLEAKHDFVPARPPQAGALQALETPDSSPGHFRSFSRKPKAWIKNQ